MKIDYEQEILRRRDMRDALTFTIDPSSAKDFDDAISYEFLGGGQYRVGVHIADVSYFVTPGSDTDKEAYEKGTSTYLVDKVIPMLPEELSNDQCSLMPNEDRLCMSVIFTMQADGKVDKYKICRTVIHSDFRLNYDEAQEIIKGETGRWEGDERGKQLTEAIRELNLMAIALRKARIAKGAMDIEGDDIRFELNEFNHPVRIYFEEANEAHHLIEELMLLANRTVATHVGDKPFIYRVHDKPDQDKLKDLRKFEKRHKAYAHDEQERAAFESALDMLMIRAQAKAVYSTVNIGHYGLQFSCYTHFTSPIRRYPDLMVHRLLSAYVLKGKKESYPLAELETIAKHCSETEVAAAEAERDSIKYYQSVYMQDRLGLEFEGHIVSVQEYGIFVRIDENHCEGMVHVSELSEEDYFDFDEKNYRLVGRYTGKSYSLGDAVRVRVVRADTLKSQVDFELISNEE